MNTANATVLRKTFLLRALIVLVVAGGGALINELLGDNAALDQAILDRARAHFDDMVIARRWNAAYGGVYVEKRAGVESSPHLRNPDIETVDGRILTLRNPALMTREMSEISARGGSPRFHITSLRLRNPANRPDDWERAALEAFAAGEKERYERVQGEGKTEARYMAPLYIEAPCLQCHADQNYRIGDVRGGIAVRFDITGILAATRARGLRSALSLAVVLAGVFILAGVFSRQLQRKLEKLSQRHADLIHSVDGIVWEADAKTFQFTFVSDKAERLLGFPGSAWMQPGFWVEHLHPDDREWAPQYCAACTGRLETHDFVYRFIARDGRTVWLRDIVSVIAENGEPTILRGVMFDVSEQKSLDSARNDLLAKQGTILNNALVGITYLRNRRIDYCNRRFEALFGYAPGELIGQSTEILYESHEAWIEIGRNAYAAIATGAGATYTVETRLRAKDGRLFWGTINGSAIDPAHPQDGSIWIYVDVTDRRNAEEEVQKLLQAIEQSPVSIVITDRDGRIEYVNPRFAAVTGHTRHEAIGQNPRILQSGETPRETYVDMWNTLLARREWRGVLRNKRKNGELFWEEASISPIVDGLGNITHFIAVKEDISERKRTEEELDRYQRHLETLVAQRTADLTAALEAAKIADRTKDAFLANVSHELRTPLNAVIGLADLARRNSGDPRQRDTLEKIADAGQTLLGIINDLLDLAKIAAGEMRFESTTFSLRRIVARVRSALGHRAAEKDLKLIEDIPEAVPDVLVGDPLRLEQILLNLVNNATKFTHAGHVTIRIRAPNVDASSAELHIEIEDSGIGMTESEVERLFRPFVQADDSISRRFGGTGLGLTICRQLTEGMGGSISVASAVSRGTTFVVRLRLPTGDPEDLPKADPATNFATSPQAFSGARVLLVEDQPLNREVVTEILERVGISPRIATNGQEAIDILKSEGPAAFDLVFMDIQMPILDGLAATREIRALDAFAALPIVAMTAHTMAHEKETYLAAGMNDHIGKPFKVNALHAVLGKWLPQHVVPATTGESGAPAGNEDALGSLAGIAGLDAHEALIRFSNNVQRYFHWLASFTEESADLVEDLERQLRTDAGAQARQTLHAFKGRAGILGMTEIRFLAESLENSLADPATAQPILAALAQSVRSMRAALAGVLASGGERAPRDQTPVELGAAPEEISALIRMILAADGLTASCIETLLANSPEHPWAEALREALEHVRHFDFDAARRVIDPTARQDA